MMNQYKRVIFAVLLLSVSACPAEENLCATGNRLSVVRTELKDALMETMRKEGIAVQESASGEVCYPPDKADYVRGKLIAIDLEQRPSNHITIAGGVFADRVFDQLKEAGIKHSHHKKEGEVLLVVEKKEDVQATVEIIDEVAKAMFTSKK